MLVAGYAVPARYAVRGRCVSYVSVYVLFCLDPMSHLAIDASSYVKLMHTRPAQILTYTPQFDTTLRNEGYNVLTWKVGKSRWFYSEPG